MLYDCLEAVNTILEEYTREASEIEQTIRSNQRRIREAEAYVSSLTGRETDDFKVFSPRKAEITHRKELEEARGQIQLCSTENETLNKRRTAITSHIENLQKVLHCLKQNSHLQEADTLRTQCIQEVAQLIEKTESMGADVDRRPFQAKQNLAIMEKRLRTLEETMENTVWFSRSPITYTEKEQK